MRLSLLSNLDDGDDIVIDDEDLYIGYRRPELVKNIILDDDDLSDYVLERLRQARELAMEAYRATKKTT